MVARPEPVRGARPDLVLLRAISAYRKSLRPWRRHSCGYRWRARLTARYCPGCRNPLDRRAKGREGEREAARLLELATGSAGAAVKEG